MFNEELLNEVSVKKEDTVVNLEHQPAPASSCDAELIARAQRGEESAFEAIYHAHKRRVYHLCFRMIGNAAEAEELTQEAFMRLFRKIHTFRGDSAFSTWLHRLSVNVVLMRLRKKTVKETSIESSEEFEESALSAARVRRSRLELVRCN